MPNANAIEDHSAPEASIFKEIFESMLLELSSLACDFTRIYIQGKLVFYYIQTFRALVAHISGLAKDPTACYAKFQSYDVCQTLQQYLGDPVLVLGLVIPCLMYFGLALGWYAVNMLWFEPQGAALLGMRAWMVLAAWIMLKEVVGVLFER